MSFENPPFLVRVAGLPSAVLRDFTGTACVDQLSQINEIEGEAKALRQETVDWIYALLTELEPRQRRGALSLKRDCFNGRGLARHRRREHWQELTQRPGGDLLNRLADLEETLEEARGRFLEIHAEQLMGERRNLLRHAEDVEFRRGLALASPLLLRQLGRLAKKPVDRYGRRERKAERSLLRYLSRAAAKLSPYSTLTKLGLGTASPRSKAAAEFLDGPWQTHSLVRAKRYLVDQCAELLLRHPAVKRRTSAVVNETLESLGEGQFRFLRPQILTLDRESNRLRFARPSQVTLRLTGALVDWLRRELDEPMNYGDLIEALVTEFDAAGDDDFERALLGNLERFFDLGLLVLRYPWPSYEPHLERRLLTFLQDLPDAPELDAARDLLRRLVDLQAHFATADDPAAVLGGIESSIPELFDAIRDASELEAPVRLERRAHHNIYEDVFVTSPSQVRGEIVKISRDKAEELLRCGDLMWRLCFLYEKKHEFILALDELMNRRWPDRERVSCLELFAEAKELWGQYLSHLAAGESEPFDPYELPAMAELRRLRGLVRTELDGLEREAEVGLELPVEGLTELLDKVPLRYRPPVGPCLFAQAADQSGEQWVAHRIFEGSGRFSSRFTPLMTGATLDDYLQHFSRRSLVEDGLGTGELIDPLFTRGNTVNLHWPQTRRVLETPGEHSDLPPDRRLTMRDLWVRKGPGVGELTVEDRDGQRVVPCYLSNLHNAFIPTLIKFLDVFGTVVRGQFGPRRTAYKDDSGATVLQRLSVGPLIIRRQRWYIDAEEVPEIAEASPAEAFAAIDRWRRRFAIPYRVYLIERVSSASVVAGVFKPQLLDFRSPSFVAVFQAALAAADGRQVVLAEALPDPDDFPLGPDGERRGLELMLEALAFDDARDSPFETRRQVADTPREAHAH